MIRNCVYTHYSSAGCILQAKRRGLCLAFKFYPFLISFILLSFDKRFARHFFGDLNAHNVKHGGSYIAQLAAVLETLYAVCAEDGKGTGLVVCAVNGVPSASNI